MRPVFVLLAAAPVLAVAAPSARLQVDAPGFHRNPSLPKWITPLAEIPPTERTTPLVTRLSETQTLIAATPATLYNRAIQVNDSSELGKIGQSLISYFSQYQKLTLHRVMILRGSQQIDHTASVSIRPMQRETEIESGMLGGATTLQLLLNDVRIGDTLCLTYTIEGENPVMGKFWAGDYSWDSIYPVERRNITILHPRNRPLQWRQLGDFHSEKIAPKIDTQGELVRIRFEGRAIEAVEPEPSVPASYLPVRMLQLSEYQDWQSVARWADSLFPKLPASPALKTLARQLSKQSDASERAAAALQWVQNEIRYFSVSIGENSHRPQAPDVVLQRRYGDCKDKSYLLVSLLRELGIQAQPLLVSATSPQFPAKVLPAASWFNHVIVQISIDGKDYYVDPTRINQPEPLAALPIAFPAASVLAVNAATTQLSTIPERSETLPTFEHTEQITIADFTGAATLVSRDIYRSTYADAMRSYFSKLSINEQKKVVLAKYEKLYPGVSLQSAPNYRDVVQDNRIEITSALQLPKAVSLKDHAYHIAMGSQILDGALDIPAKLVRNFPFAPSGGLYSGRYRLQIHWPEQVRRNDTPYLKMIDNAYFSAREEYGLRGADVDYLFDFRLKQREVPAAQLPMLGEQARLLNEFVEGSLRVQESAVEKASLLNYSMRDLESLRLAGQALEQADQLRGRKDSEINAEQACNYLATQHSLYEFVGSEGAQIARRMEQKLTAEKNAAPAECMTRLWLARGQPAEALAAWRSQPASAADAPIQRELAWAEFYADQPAAALARMQAYRAAKESSNGGMINSADAASHIALLQRSGQTLPAALAQFAREMPDGPWPRPILAMQLGFISQQDLLKQVDSMRRDRQALAREEAWFYIGQARLAAQDHAGALQAFRWVQGHGLRNQPLWRQALCEIQRDFARDKLAEAGIKAQRDKQYARAIELWQQGAAAGSAASQYGLALAALRGSGMAASSQQAVQWLEPAAARGYPEAQTMLAMLYTYGQGVPKDLPKSIQLLQDSALQGEPQAQMELGRRYRWGDGVKQDFALARQWLESAADQGNDDAMAQLAAMYSNAEGMAANHLLANFWNERAAMYDNIDAAFNMGYALESGAGGETDYPRALRLYQIAAERGHSAAANNLGSLYQHGRGTERNYRQALTWYRKAADLGNALAFKNLAVMYQDGLGVEADVVKATEYFTEAAARGNVYSMLQIGYIFDTVIKDAQQAKTWYEKAAEHHDATAEYNLAMMYKGDQLGKPDRQKMLYWHQRAADDGDADSQLAYGRALMFGNGIAANQPLGLEYLQKASAQELPEALGQLGRLYLFGFGTEANPALARELLTKAAASGRSESILDLGRLYEEGRGTQIDYRQAVYWYEKIAQQSLEAQVRLGTLLKQQNLDPARGQQLLTRADQQTTSEQYLQLARVYSDIRQIDKAITTYERSIALADQAKTTDDQSSHNLLQEFINYLIETSRFSAAEPYAERSLQLAQKLYSEDDQRLLDEIEKTCDLHQQAARYGDAETCYLHLIMQLEKHRGPRSEAVAALFESIAGLYREMEQFARGIDYAMRAKAIYLELGSDDLHFAERTHAALLGDNGQYAEAASMLKTTLERERGRSSPNHLRIATIEHQLGRLYLKWQRNDAAHSLLANALASIESRTPNNEKFIANLRNSLARSHIAQGNYTEAGKLIKLTKDFWAKLGSPDQRGVKLSVFLSATIDNRQRHYQQALPALQKALEFARQSPYFNKAELAEVLQELSISYQGLGQPDQARQALSEALALRSAIYNEQHPLVQETRHMLAGLAMGNG